MSMLGKLLAVGNVLVAVGFLSLAAMDWAKRHAWTYAVYRHELALTGLPIDDKESDPTDDAPAVDKLSDKTLESLFQPAGGQPVKTQKAEVEKAKSQFQADINGQADDTAKKARLLARLLPLARTAGEREELRNRVANKPVAELLADADTLFQFGGTPAADSLAGLLLPRDERSAIAHLLYSLYADDASQPRLQVVLGLRALNEEVNRQAAATATMVQQTYAHNLRERTNFEVAHRAEVDRMRSLVEHITDRRFTLSARQAEKQRHDELLASRQQEVQQILADTEKARVAHKANLDAQRAEEQQIFQSQQLYHRTKLENEQLERDIRNLEKADGEKKP